MEKYLEAADKALSMAIPGRPKPPPVVDKRYSIKDGHPVRGSTEDVYRFLDDGGSSASAPPIGTTSGSASSTRPTGAITASGSRLPASRVPASPSPSG